MGEVVEKRRLGWMYKEISSYLKNRGFRSVRGRELNSKIVERMEKGYWKKIERENRIEYGIGRIRVLVNGCIVE